MDNVNLQRRKELATALMADLKDINSLLADAASAIENESGMFYDEAFKEKQEELQLELESHRSNSERVREINNTITASINSWYEFIKNENETGKLIFPLVYNLRKRSLYKSLKKLNAEIYDILIKNRFIKEKLTILEHQLEIKAMSLAKSGSNYQNYEKLLQKQDSISAELKYLLPTIKDQMMDYS